MRFFAPAFALLFLAGVVGAQDGVSLDESKRTNGSQTLDALSMMQSRVRPSVAQVINQHGETMQLAVVVSEDGYVLTKASELHDADRLTLAWPDGTQGQATVVVVDRRLDLLLARTSRTDAIPLEWGKATSVGIGDWVSAFAKPEQGMPVLKLGNISAKRRAIAGKGSALGIEMDDRQQEAVRVVDVGVASPADVAGLKRDDLIVEIEDQKVTGIHSIREEVDRRQPGEAVKLRVRRGKAEHDLNVRLASRRTVMANFTGEDYANGGVSLRTDDFGDVLQLQMPVSPRDMGGPLLDLDGKAIGLNISRVDRVTTFALPVEVFWSKVQEWLVLDRKEQAEGTDDHQSKR